MNISPYIGQAKKIGWPGVLMLGMSAVLLAGPLQAQDSDYLEAMKAASQARPGSSVDQQKPAASASDATAGDTDQGGGDVIAEFENVLQQKYPEEFAMYKRLDEEQRADVIAEFERYIDKPDNIRYLKAINKIGLLSRSGGWEL
jgi:hypothetical protein